MAGIHQFVAGFSHGDAISNEARVMRGVFRSWGYDSDIFCETRRILPQLRNEAKDVDNFAANSHPDDVVLLHLSVGSEVNEIFAELPCKKAILYHNITPADYFRGTSERIATLLAKGREQAERLAGSASVVMADSQFNADELKAWGYPKATVLPLILDLKRLREKRDKGILREYDDSHINVLFVGRCVPNKRLEDCLYAFYYFQKFVEPSSRFFHIGSFAGTEQYHTLLLTKARELLLEDVIMPGAVQQDELNAYYQCADIFLSMSEHEGFGIPLIESMVHDVPILAYDAAAVSETLDGAGVLFKEKQFDVIAEMMGKMVNDQAFRKSIISGQQDRLNRFENRDLATELREHLAPLL